MSSIKNGVLNVAVGLLSKFRDYTATKLEGDLSDEKCCQLILIELDDIKTKLDGFSRKDLLSSLSFLKEGLRFLKLSRPESTDDETSFAQDHKEDLMIAVSGGSSLSQTIASTEHFTSAKSFFKQSNTEATRAFNNEALGMEDRILATKLRVMSRILENLEDTDAVASSCVRYLKDLHDIPAVQEIFSVQLSGGMKSRLNKTKRLEEVMSVTLINFIVFDFAKKFTKRAVNLLTWPTIELGKRTYNPIILEGEILKKVEESGARVPNQFTLMKEKQIISGIYFPQVNRKREIIGKVSGESRNVCKFTAGKGQFFSTFPQEDTEANGFAICSLANDGQDNVYVVTRSETPYCYHYKLFVFDAEGNKKHESPLHFLNGSRDLSTIAVTEDMIVIHQRDEDHVHICDSSGQRKYSFHLEEKYENVNLSISDKNEISVAPCVGNVVYIYTEGKLKKIFEVPEHHKVWKMAFNHLTKEIIVLTGKSANFYLSSYSETGELRRTSQLPPQYKYWEIEITSHPSGPVALIYDEHVLYIQ